MYHITAEINLPTILGWGLADCEPVDIGNKGNGIMLFNSVEDAIFVYANEFLDEILDWESMHGMMYEPIVLQIDVSDLAIAKSNGCYYITNDSINPLSITGTNYIQII